jgi:hypothetical protein
MSEIKSAILGALREEKKWYRKSFLILLLALSCGAVLFLGLRWYWQEAHWFLHSVLCLWSLALGAGLYLVLKPQPRVEVEGYWSRYVFAKLLLVVALVGVGQLLLCPHFAQIDDDMGGLEFFKSVTDFYMSLGGMSACFFLCGITFGSIAGVAGQWWLRKSSSVKQWRPYVFSSLIIFILLEPINLLQFNSGSHAHQEMSPLYWPLGLLLGVFGGGLLVLLFTHRRPVKVGVPSSLSDFLSFYTKEPLVAAKKDSVFFEQAETHCYSDWLLPSIYETGWDYGNDFYFAGFPDISEALKREKGAFTWNESAWKTYRREGLTPLGRKLQDRGRGKIFLDLGSGLKEVSCVPRKVAEEFGAGFYVGIDKIYNESALFKDGTRQEFSCFYISADVFEFVERMKASADWVVFLAGLEIKDRKNADALLEAQRLMQLLSKAMKKGALLLLGAASHDFQPASHDFKFIGQDRYHRLYLRR